MCVCELHVSALGRNSDLSPLSRWVRGVLFD